MPELKEAISKARQLVMYFHRSSRETDELNESQHRYPDFRGHVKSLLLDVKTRWNSTLQLIESVVELYDHITTAPIARSAASRTELDRGGQDQSSAGNMFHYKRLA